MTLPDPLAHEIRGPAGIRRDIVAFLRADLPVHLEACRAAWGLTEAQLPTPVSKPDVPKEDAYLPREAATLDRFPLIAVTSGRQTGATRDFAEDGSPQLTTEFPVRVFSWVRGPDHDSTVDMRDWMGTALQITFLSHTTLGDASGRLQIVPSTVLVDFSDVTPVKGDRFVAGSYVGFTLRATETLTARLTSPGAAAGDTVSGVTVTGDATMHPALLP